MEKLTQEELGLLAVSLNAKLRELQSGLDMMLLEDSTLKKRYEEDLKNYKILQQKLFRMYKFQ